jgi:hypothetical protein
VLAIGIIASWVVWQYRKDAVRVIEAFGFALLCAAALNGVRILVLLIIGPFDVRYLLVFIAYHIVGLVGGSLLLFHALRRKIVMADPGDGAIEEG